MKKLFIVGNLGFYPAVEGIDYSTIYKSFNVFFRAFRYWHIRSDLFPRLIPFWYGSWKQNVEEYDEIVIIDTILDNYIIPYIRKKNKEAILKLCYRNRVHIEKDHSFFNRDPTYWKTRYECEPWSYNKDDCQKYDMKFYNQFYLSKIKTSEIEIQDLDYDVFFIGKDKKRMKLLISVKDVLIQKGYIPLFKVVPDRKTNYNKMEKSLLSKPVPYEKVLEYDLKSKCILDIVIDSNYGLTYRALEALFLNKKLITNFKEIKEYGFYYPSNVFIIGVDSWDNFDYFMNSSYTETAEKEKSNYLFSTFVKHIFNY